ncbi:hypothetical protein BDEG_26434 [Batrachochytrium dendrobatidis JEL423]|uniref:Dynactin subunit 6 n=1 Tax=Batrachochytrium dendrobatidis (strain JEL423) TaxID=403673 RepID=A0A177WSF9_BATDL|nr:hypothetical protein BDEG_26434 [Batrachochytrium dendrobatidis JEL423]
MGCQKTSRCRQMDRVQGEVDLGTSNIFQPHVRIIQEQNAGPIVIGTNNIFEECVTIINKSPGLMKIGNNNLFNTGCCVYAGLIGDYCTISPRAIVGQGSCIEDNCIIGSKCEIPPNQHISKGTLIYGRNNSFRKIASTVGFVAPLHSKHIDYLVQVLPKYHPTRK